jgi:hypothetical protein
LAALFWPPYFGRPSLAARFWPPNIGRPFMPPFFGRPFLAALFVLSNHLWAESKPKV